MKTRVVLGCALALAWLGGGSGIVSAATAPGGAPSLSGPGGAKEIRPNGHFYKIGLSRPRGSGSGNGISYHGGPVILGTTNVYYIWYGNWSSNVTSNNTGQSILTNFISNLGGSPYFNINTTYYDGSGTHVSNAVHYAGTTNDSYSRGTSLSDADIQTIVASHVGHDLPADSNAVYFVLTSQDVDETSGFGTQYCGWHTDAAIGGKDIKYAFVGDPYRYQSACEAQTKSPNGNASADAMASVVAHETQEAVTDEDLNAWYDNQGNENADKCAWTFGSTSTAGNGSKYNVTLGGKQYLIQQNWVNASGGYCAMSY